MKKKKKSLVGWILKGIKFVKWEKYPEEPHEIFVYIPLIYKSCPKNTAIEKYKKCRITIKEV